MKRIVREQWNQLFMARDIFGKFYVFLIVENTLIVWTVKIEVKLFGTHFAL